MKSTKRRPGGRHIPVVLMAASLMLLAAFLGFFLYNTYQDEKNNLNKEVGLLFVSAVRQVEGGLFDQLLFRQRPGEDSLQLRFSAGATTTIQEAPAFAFIGDAEQLRLTPPGGDSSRVEIRVIRQETLQETDNPSELRGAISMVVTTDDDSLNLREEKEKAVDFGRDLTRRFQQAMAASGLRVSYRISTDTVAADTLQWLTPGSYTDMASGRRFYARIGGYQGWVLRQMIPEVVFALLLFGCVALAFGLAYRSLAAQRRLMDLKNDFIQNVSHELKTPIATVSVALEALRDFDALNDRDRTEEYLSISQNELQRLSLLVNKVLALNQLEARAPELRKTTFNLVELFREVLDSLRPQLEKTGAQVNLQAPETALMVTADRFHLAGVVFNLLDNAIKYSPEAPRIDIVLDARPDGVLMQVQDQGAGIPEAHRERIFEKFYRAPSGAVHNVKGHGLGLSYAARVVAQHGGRIWSEAAAPKGARFSVWLPAA